MFDLLNAIYGNSLKIRWTVASTDEVRWLPSTKFALK
jgi:hypothetical protein